MRIRHAIAIVVALGALAAAFFAGTGLRVSGEGRNTALPRTADGKPDFSGIWQAMNTANWNLQAHAASRGPGGRARRRVQHAGGLGVVEGNEIPYLPDARRRRKENAENWLTRDPEIKCYMPGDAADDVHAVSRSRSFSRQNTILMASEFASASRVVRMNSQEKSPTPSRGWDGRSAGGKARRWSSRPRITGSHLVRSRRQLPQRGAARDRAIHAGRPEHDHLRGDDGGSQGLHPARGRSACRSIAVSRQTRS